MQSQWKLGQNLPLWLFCWVCAKYKAYEFSLYTRFEEVMNWVFVGCQCCSLHDSICMWCWWGACLTQYRSVPSCNVQQWSKRRGLVMSRVCLETFCNLGPRLSSENSLQGTRDQTWFSWSGRDGDMCSWVWTVPSCPTMSPNRSRRNSKIPCFEQSLNQRENPSLRSNPIRWLEMHCSCFRSLG